MSNKMSDKLKKSDKLQFVVLSGSEYAHVNDKLKYVGH
jgi:hypothetical protein